jgi:hypothetical protein
VQGDFCLAVPIPFGFPVSPGTGVLTLPAALVHPGEADRRARPIYHHHEGYYGVDVLDPVDYRVDLIERTDY